MNPPRRLRIASQLFWRQYNHCTLLELSATVAGQFRRVELSQAEEEEEEEGREGIGNKIKS